ncbi:glycosyltransferase family 9 protein, partial [Saccharomonospora iraqiensis]|uniref:glycosyltransferase family 9 protein n=1 Tax=Saccharomonospora iraqiensis TaxID=52698 RepID=UPI000592A509
VVTAGPGERDLAAAVAAGAGLGPDAVVTTDLAGTAALVADAALVICGDTGIGHLATAFGTPSVLLFGPTPPDRWGPPPRARHRVLWAGTTGDPHADTPDPGLVRLSVPRVVRTARTLLFGGEPCQHTPVHAARTPRQADSRSGSSAPATSD